jgi:hypothetical protein
VLRLEWERDTAKGTLRIDGKTKPVVALLYKGLILVDSAGTAKITGKVAMLTPEPNKTIRLGGSDSKQPELPCR